MRHAILLGKSVISVSQKLKLGSGSTWPGHLALKADRGFIKKIIKKNPDLKIILIAGTNGKTTTTKALKTVLNDNGIETLTNEAGANLLNGLATLISKHADFSGKIKKKVLVFESDENTLPQILKEISNPSCIILLNLFRDQLDRYGEVNTIAENWKKSLSKIDEKTLVIANGDDPLIAFCAKDTKNKFFFSIPNNLKKARTLSHAVDSINCPNCHESLEYLNISYSHLGNYLCPNCKFKNPESKGLAVNSILYGDYNQYNLNAVLLASLKVFNISEKDALDSLEKFTPAFGRQEKTTVDNKNIMYLLSKNPTGFNESLRVAIEISSTLLILLNDRIPDGRDISWIWDVDFELLKNKKIKIVVSGDRSYDLSNRLIFAGVTHSVFEDANNAYKDALKKTPVEGQLTILPTYSALLEIRKIITGKSIL